MTCDDTYVITISRITRAHLEISLSKVAVKYISINIGRIERMQGILRYTEIIKNNLYLGRNHMRIRDTPKT